MTSTPDNGHARDTDRGTWSALALVQDRDEEARERQRQRRQRESVVIPRLRAGGYLGLMLVVFVHNWLVLGSLSGKPLLMLGAVCLVYFAISKFALVRFARENARIDWNHWFLTGDIAVFALAVYASGGNTAGCFQCCVCASPIRLAPRCDGRCFSPS